jgi:hypothetical protein
LKKDGKVTDMTADKVFSTNAYLRQRLLQKVETKTCQKKGTEEVLLNQQRCQAAANNTAGNSAKNVYAQRTSELFLPE